MDDENFILRPYEAKEMERILTIRAFLLDEVINALAAREVGVAREAWDFYESVELR